MRTCEMCMMMDDCKIGNVRMCILDTPSPLKFVRYQLVQIVLRYILALRCFEYSGDLFAPVELVLQYIR